MTDFGLRSTTRAFDSQIEMGVGLCEVSFFTGVRGKRRGQQQGRRRGGGRYAVNGGGSVQASVSSEIKLDVESVSVLSPGYAAGPNSDVDFRVQLQLCGQSVKLSLHPIMIQSVAQVFLASKAQVCTCVRTCVRLVCMRGDRHERHRRGFLFAFELVELLLMLLLNR